VKLVLAIAITLLPTAALAEQFTPQQMLDVMTKSPENRDVRVHDAAIAIPMYQGDEPAIDWRCSNDGLTSSQVPLACSY